MKINAIPRFCDWLVLSCSIRDQTLSLPINPCNLVTKKMRPTLPDQDTFQVQAISLQTIRRWARVADVKEGLE